MYVLVLLVCVFKGFNVREWVCDVVAVFLSQGFGNRFRGFHYVLLNFSVHHVLFQARRLIRWDPWLCFSRYAPYLRVTWGFFRSSCVLYRALRLSRSFLCVLRLQACCFGKLSCAFVRYFLWFFFCRLPRIVRSFFHAFRRNFLLLTRYFGFFPLRFVANRRIFVRDVLRVTSEVIRNLVRFVARFTSVSSRLIPIFFRFFT